VRRALPSTGHHTATFSNHRSGASLSERHLVIGQIRALDEDNAGRLAGIVEDVMCLSRAEFEDVAGADAVYAVVHYHLRCAGLEVESLLHLLVLMKSEFIARSQANYPPLVLRPSEEVLRPVVPVAECARRLRR